MSDAEPVWAKPLGALKAHVFYRGKPLCGIPFFGEVPENPDFHSAKEECRICRSRLKEAFY